MNNFKALLTWGLLLAATHVMGYTITVDPIQIQAGQNTNLIINLTNTETDLTAYQMKLYLPTGVTVQKKSNGKYNYTINADRHDGVFSPSVKDAADGSILITCYSSDKDVITGTSGELIRLPLVVASTVTTSLQGSLKSIEFTDVQSTAHKHADVTFNLTMATQEAQTLSLTALPEMTEGDAAYTLPQKTDQGLNLTWSVANTTIASISGNLLTPLKAGTTTVTATQAGNSTYQPFTKTFTLTVKEKPAQPTVEVTDISQMSNVIYIEPIEAKTGTQTTISFKMKNTAEIRSFQFELYLPEGVTVVKSSKGRIQGSLSAGRLPEEDEHSLTFSEHEGDEGSFIRFLCDSEYGDTFTGNDGEIATLQVNIAETMADGDYPILMKNMKLSEVDIANYYQTASISTKLTVSSYTLGDINSDGVVDVSDYSGVASHIHGNTPAGFVEIAGDVDESGNIDVSDYSGIANIIHYGSIHGSANQARSMIRKANTNIDNLDNVIYIKPFTATAGTQTSISICMKNTAEIRSFQFDLYLPEGITAAKSDKGRIRGTLSEERLPEEDEHKLTFSEHEGDEGGFIRFLCDSEYGDTFTGNDGEIATLLVNIAETMTDGDYPILMKNMKLSEVDIANYYLTDEIETTVTIGEAAIVYTILDENSTTAPAAATNVNVRVLRTINANEWSTICLPFSMTAAQVQTAFGEGVELADFTGCDVTTKGDDVVGITVNFQDVTPLAIEANHPYIIKVTTPITHDDGFTVDNVDINPTDELSVDKDENRVKISNKWYTLYNSFIGTYAANTEVPENCLFLSGNKFWYSKGLTTMNAFRAYFDFYDVLSEVASGARINMSFNHDGGAITGISERKSMGESEGIFDLQGRKIEKPLRKGLYIRDGKKFVK